MIHLCLSSQISYTQETPSVVPPAVEELLMKQHLDWTSQTWTALWGDTLIYERLSRVNTEVMQ